ncbi:hypothetical protein QQ045_024101 [Rhodiola kirilowii]
MPLNPTVSMPPNPTVSMPLNQPSSAAAEISIVAVWLSQRVKWRYWVSLDASLPGLKNSMQPLPPPGEGGMEGQVVAGEDMSKKIRKPYVISKSRESWTELEHEKFLEALHL